ncbi:BgTH12-05446 [Blumeria graminis f. sp. triticale]|uniref:BgTH12-05446 n=1 Tax=Blumeria graminis f. sp. triticale TaxID=1689686 RepID=A0A9W4D2S2_BLUGR|nr:BgTH12-05446 [Blumeria graminis f. sp. triticale]
MDRCEQNLSLVNTTMTRTEELCINRQLILTMLSPSCRPLETSSTVREFVAGIRDAIIGHRNLHESGMIIDEFMAENIILSKPDKTGVGKGFMVDLDMAYLRRNHNNLDYPKAMSGKKSYMALELLRAIQKKENTLKQTYRHHLESFFYVFIVGCMSYGRKSAPGHLRYWHYANNSICCTSKESNIINHFQEQILNYFTPVFECVQELALSLRQILFEDKSVGYGTPEDPNVLYDPIIRAFDDTIRKLDADV